MAAAHYMCNLQYDLAPSQFCAFLTLGCWSKSANNQNIRHLDTNEMCDRISRRPTIASVIHFYNRVIGVGVHCMSLTEPCCDLSVLLRVRGWLVTTDDGPLKLAVLPTLASPTTDFTDFLCNINTQSCWNVFVFSTNPNANYWHRSHMSV